MVAQSTERIVRDRAHDRFKYCHLPQAFSARRFQMDHVHARQRVTDDTLENLALSCDRCNGHKGPNVAGVDPVTRKIIPLFNPRTQEWDAHFAWDGARVIGLTPTGSVTIQVPKMNDLSAMALCAAIMRHVRL